MKISHTELCQLGALLDYPLVIDGLCAGLSAMLALAVLAGDEGSFYARLHFIEQYQNTEQLPQKLMEVRQKIKTQGAKSLTEEERQILEIPAFFEGIMLYLEPSNQKDLFHSYLNQNNFKEIYALAHSKALEGKQVPFELLDKDMVFSQDSLDAWLTDLKMILSTTSAPMPIILSNDFHSVFLKYNTQEQCWVYTDSNDFARFPEEKKYYRELNTKELTKSIFTSFFDDIDKHTLFTTQLFALNPNQQLKKQFKQFDATYPIQDKHVTIYNSNNAGLLFIACQNGHLEVIRLLINTLKNKKAINQPTNSGATPLYIACKNGHLEIVSLLIKALQDKKAINQTKNNGATPLFIACQKGHLEIVSLLIKALEDKEAINQPLNDGTTPLFIASEKGHLEIVSLLINTLQDKQAINQPMNNGATPLYIACQNGRLEIVSLLINALQDKNAINRPMNNGATPLFIACQNGHLEIVSLLINALKDKNAINRPENDGATPLYIACENGFIAVVEELLKNGAYLKSPIEASTQVLLEEAKKHKCDEKLRRLFAQEHIEDTLPEFSPLHAAVIFGHREIVLLLLKYGAPIEKPSQGISVYKLAVAMDRMDILPTKLQQLYSQLENTLTYITVLLQDYTKTQDEALYSKDELNSEEKQAKEEFIEYITNVDNFLDSGNEQLLKAIQKGLTQFPDLQFQTTLYNIIVHIVDDTPPHNKCFAKALSILEQQKISNPSYFQQLSKLYQQLEAMHALATELTHPQTTTATTLLTQLKNDVDFFISQHENQLPDETSMNHFKTKFNARVHSQDLVLSQQTNWNSSASNLLLTVNTMSISLDDRTFPYNSNTKQLYFAKKELKDIGQEEVSNKYKNTNTLSKLKVLVLSSKHSAQQKHGIDKL